MKEGIKKEEKMMKELILVQIVRGGHHYDYYIVDLGAKKVRKTPIASLLNEGGAGSSVCLGPVLYNLGGEPTAGYLDFKTIDGDYYIHSGASCLTLNIPHLLSLLKGEGKGEGEGKGGGGEDGLDLESTNKWNAAPLMQHRHSYLRCASLGGRIYAVGGSMAKLCIGEVFIPELVQWDPLAPPPSDVPVVRNCVSYPVIPDEKNERLLVHFRNVNSLYAYYPATRTWDCLAKNSLRHWKRATALVGDVVYFHIKGMRDCIVAYDLLAKDWLNVEYFTEFTANVCMSKFTDMLHMGNGVLCLANSCPFFDKNHAPDSLQTNLQFVIFRVEHSPPTKVLVTPIAAQCFPFKGYWTASQFFLL